MTTGLKQKLLMIRVCVGVGLRLEYDGTVCVCMWRGEGGGLRLG